MLRKIIFAVFFILVGVAFLRGSYQLWRDDQTRQYELREAEVLSHRVSINWERWKEREREAMEVETRIDVLDTTRGTRVPLVLREHFVRGEKAGDLAHAEPAGARIKCLVSPDMKIAVRTARDRSGAIAVLIIGGLILSVGIGMLVPVSLSGQGQRQVALVVLPVLPIGGLIAAWFAWPGVLTPLESAHWTPVTYEKLGQRSVSAGKTSELQIAIRYSIGGQTFESVLTRDKLTDADVTVPKSGECRVNPEKPWQVALQWGWRPVLFAMILFPVPFLATGLLLLGTFVSPYLQHQFGVRAAQPRPPRQGPWEEAAGLGFATLFMASLVGVFVAVCVEMWFNDAGLKWFLTIFLIPFVCMVIYFLSSFGRSVWKAMRI